MSGFVNLMHSRTIWEENLNMELSRSGRPGGMSVGVWGIILIILIKVERPSTV